MDFQEHTYKKYLTISKAFLGIFTCMAYFFAFILSSTIYAQDQKKVQGSFSLKNYSPDEYGAHYQNWFITQDQLGLIYAGNGDGILEYDGVYWRLIKWPGLRSVRSIIVDKDNVKWVGADRELGYLEPDSLGFLQFKSLKDKIPESHPLTGTIWKVFATSDGILFVTDDTIYMWKGDRFTIIPSTGYLNKEFQVNGEIYFRIKEHGLFRLQGDSLRLVPNGDLFKNLRIDVLFPYKGDSLLFVSRDDGVFTYGVSGVTKIPSEVDQYLKENTLYTGLMLPDSTYALATLRGGVIIMDKNGKYLKKITVDNGILTNQIHELALDGNNGLWLAHQMGISRIEPFLPYTIFGKESGLEGTIWSVAQHKGSIYAATNGGLYILELGVGLSPPIFRRIQGIERACLSILSVEQGLLVATADGTFLVSDHETKLVEGSIGARTLYRSAIDSLRIYIGHYRGLASLYLKNGKWQDEKNQYGLDDHIVDILETKDKSLWIRTALQYIVRVNLPKIQSKGKQQVLDNIVTESYGQDSGFPDGFTHIFVMDEELYANANRDDGPLFKFNFKKDKFSPAPQFGQRFGLDSLSVYPLEFQGNGEHILLESVRQEGNSYRFSAHKNPINGSYSISRIYDERSRSTSEISAFWDDNNQIWLGGEWVTKYDLVKPVGLKSNFDTYIRKVITGQDSIIFAGNNPASLNPKLNHSNGRFRFEYAAPSFRDPEAKRYQYRLAGFENAWSDWTNETRKDYTNLPEGNYKFQARAQNIYGDVSKADIFEFTILPPWYRTWWAYLFYILLFIAFLLTILRWRSSQLKAQNETLEKLIAVRTSEVQHQANQLKIQAEKLQELDKAKSRFFANISHEFRTPLTLIKGPIEQLEQNFSEKLNMETVKMIRRNANRLLNMVNQLLDLSKIDEGSLRLAPTEGDVYKCLRAAASSFNSHAAQRNMDYRVEIPTTVLWASFDRDKLENIIYNLLGNAFKFSGDGSKISFVADYSEYGLQIRVSDAGKGIPTEKLPFIFDRFFQVDNSNTRDKGGSGIGLSLSKDLVELMDGTITVSSEIGKGTFFIVQLPIQEIKTRQNSAVENEVQIEKFLVKKPFALTKTDKRNLPSILLVEDNRDMRHFITEQLIKSYKVIASVNGEEGFQKALANAPDLIITDLMMPRMDGIELCKKLKTDLHTSHIPVIMLTAKAGMENKIEGLETGADDYLTKPFDGKELLVRTKNLIDQRQNLRELYSKHEIQVDPKRITVTSIDQKFLEEVLSLLESNYSDPDFGVPQMQKALAMSKTQLHRKLKSLTNEAPGELLRNFRLKRAAQLLSQKADSVTQIAYKVGFNNLSYFAKCFKELYGVAPSAY